MVDKGALKYGIYCLSLGLFSFFWLFFAFKIPIGASGLYQAPSILLGPVLLVLGIFFIIMAFSKPLKSRTKADKVVDNVQDFIEKDAKKNKKYLLFK